VPFRRFRRLGGSEERLLSARIVAGTNSSLETAVTDNRFRADLFYRLNVARLQLPPLRDREGDIPVLAHYFVKRHSEAEGRENLRLAPDSVSALERHRWPGNIRELKNVIERAALMCSGPELTLGELPAPLMAAAAAQGPEDKKHFADQLRNLEVELIRDALRRSDNNQTRAARLLNMPLRTLVYKIRVYGLRKGE